MILNTVAAFINTASLYFISVSSIITKDMQTFLVAETWATFSYLAICILALISGTYLGLAINRIRKLITEKEDIINTKIMTI